MNCIELLTIFVANLSITVFIFLFFIKITRLDRKQLEQEVRVFREKWSDESKDFHARLYNLEERYKIKHEKHHG